ncbi:MAG TPA: DUF5683 domain-containing protein [Proteiniphilum sp.]|nr:DUF5683 domain-containing protein [Proteiniphilum sp.]HPD86418.1 DUF5683 domain-containing protein [Proteiniphilum sp.]HPJ49617.1 DUF5683 domain-containing protein [Proteiniphilum sp.]HPR19894.1 DUF5683 domain-containing protein [Proteiniphilum sp.]
MKQAAFLLGLIFAFGSTLLQAQETTAPALSPEGDLLPRDSVLTQTVDTVTFIDAVDSLLVATPSDSFFASSERFRPTPRKAVLYSAIFPGMGQVYNRKYWKLPILYGGFVGFTYAITWNNGLYRDYLGSYQDIMDSNPETNRWHDLLPYGRDPETIDQKWFTDVLQKRKDYYRYYRDLSIIGTVALYMLAMVDAYVDAQLFDFDMSTDLSMQLAPAVLREPKTGISAASSYGLQLSFNF